jgi:phosphatidylglycerophosphate synthase
MIGSCTVNSGKDATGGGFMTIPNLITAIRIILAPVFVIFLINDDLRSALFVSTVWQATALMG